jgi:hypothetical protein
VASVLLVRISGPLTRIEIEGLVGTRRARRP